MAEPDGTIAVTFLSRLTGRDPAGYDRASRRMEMLARDQPGFAGIASARGADGMGITRSLWTDEAAALAWRDHPEHAAIRDAGRDRWYEAYEVEVSRVLRRYRWKRP